MLRASIRSALQKYRNHIGLINDSEVSTENISFSVLESKLLNIEKSLRILDDPNHHKMMRKELCMNIFPFGNDGADISMVIKLVYSFLNQSRHEQSRHRLGMGGQTSNPPMSKYFSEIVSQGHIKLTNNNPNMYFKSV